MVVRDRGRRRGLGVPEDDALPEAVEAAKTCRDGATPAPFAAAKAFAMASRALNAGTARSLGGRGGEGEVLAAALADAVLAQKLNWPFVLPLLAAGLHGAGGRRAPGDAGEDEQLTRILSAFARAAAMAFDLSAELGRRAQKLQDVAPKLRAKGAGAALAALLDDDA